MDCSVFWCVHYDCPSFHSGASCPSCSQFCECDSCVLSDTSPNIDACRQLAYEIAFGFSEEEDF